MNDPNKPNHILGGLDELAEGYDPVRQPDIFDENGSNEIDQRTGGYPINHTVIETSTVVIVGDFVIRHGDGI